MQKCTFDMRVILYSGICNKNFDLEEQMLVGPFESWDFVEYCGLVHLNSRNLWLIYLNFMVLWAVPFESYLNCELLANNLTLRNGPHD